MSIDAVRGRNCKTDYDREVLSTGDCAVQGYVASMDVTLRTTAIKDAATLVGLIGRLHGDSPKVNSFDVSSAQAARRSAMAVATKDASASAAALAQAAGKHLGRIISITDTSENSETNDIVVTARRQTAAPALVLPPVEVHIAPATIETTASVTVTYELMQ